MARGAAELSRKYKHQNLRVVVCANFSGTFPSPDKGQSRDRLYLFSFTFGALEHRQPSPHIARETMVSRTATTSLVLVGSLLLSEHSDAAATTSRKGRRRGGVAAKNDNRQLRTRKLSKGAKKQYEPHGDGLISRNDNGGGAFQPPVLAGCFRDFKVCDSTGTLVSRNPALGCDFDPCPPGEGDNENNESNANQSTSTENSDTDGNAPQDQPPANDDNDSTPSQQAQQYHPIQIIEENMPVTPGESNNEYTEGDFLLPNGAWVGCNWVARKKTAERCKDMTANNELVSDLCPDVCNAATIEAILEENTPVAVSTAPNNLADSTETLIGIEGNFTLTSGMTVDCEWVEKRVESRCFKKTDDGRQVRYLCPVCTHVVEIVNPISSVDNTTSDGL